MVILKCKCCRTVYFDWA